MVTRLRSAGVNPNRDSSWTSSASTWRSNVHSLFFTGSSVRAPATHDRGGNVTNFKRSNRIYNRAENHNSDLDRDNDHIACEKA